MRLSRNFRFVGWMVLDALIPVLSVAADLRMVEASRSQDHEAIRALLREHADVNAPQGDGATALHWAAYWDDSGMVDLLVGAGANVNAANDLGVTPLALASSSAVANRLLVAGANPNLVTTAGVSPLMNAALAGRTDIVQALLEHGADVNAQEKTRGQTALMWAVSERHPDTVRVLLEGGADVRLRT